VDAIRPDSTLTAELVVPTLAPQAEVAESVSLMVHHQVSGTRDPRLKGTLDCHLLHANFIQTRFPAASQSSKKS
jgi:hypothetical protein